MPLSITTYLGDLRTSSFYSISGKELITDAPVESGGKGESFTPTDLLVTALANCMLTNMGILATRMKINIEGTTCSITKIMAVNPRRIGEIHALLTFPVKLSVKEKSMLENATKTCPIFYSLHADIKVQLEMEYPVH